MYPAQFHASVPFLGETIALWLPSAEWSAPPSLRYELETQVEAGLTSREHRRPAREALRLTARARLLLADAEAQALLDALLSLGDRRVGIPLWSDVLPPARWAERVHEAEWVVDYDAAGYALHARGALPAEPVHAWRAPLLVGRLAERPELAALSDTVCSLTLAVREDAPWDARIGVANLTSAVTPVDWPPELVPDWSSSVTDSSEDTLEYIAVGAGRLQLVDGQEGATRRSQEATLTLASRDQVRTLLRFWLSRSGRAQSFVAAWALQPGGTAATGRVRFAGDRLDLDHLSPDAAQVAIRLIEVPAEATPPLGEVALQPAEAYLYRFWVDVPGETVAWLYTDWERPIALPGGGAPAVYAPAAIEHDAVTQTLDLGDSPTTIAAGLVSGHPLLRLLQRTLDVPLHIEIRRCDPVDPATAVVVYAGEVVEVEQSGRRLKARTQVLGGLLDAKVPGFLFSPVCNHEFAGAGCGLDPAAWTFAGTIASALGTELYVTVTGNPPSADLVSGYFDRAWLKKGAGEAHELRQIMLSEQASPTLQRFVLKRPLREAPVGAAVTFRPYCQGTRTECQDKFANYANFGGHPHIGPRNLTVPQRETRSSGGKK